MKEYKIRDFCKKNQKIGFKKIKTNLKKIKLTLN